MILGLSISAFLTASLLTFKGLVDLQSALLIYGIVALFLPFAFNTVEWKSEDSF